MILPGSSMTDILTEWDRVGDGRVTHLAGPTSLHKNFWVSQPGKVGEGETIKACASATKTITFQLAELARALLSQAEKCHINACYLLLTRLGW